MRLLSSNYSFCVVLLSAAILISIFNYGCAATTQSENETLVDHEPETLVANIPLVNRIVDIKNNRSDFKVTIWTEKGSDRYRIGEDVVYVISTNRDSYVTLFNIGTSGNIYQIYPNEYQRDNFCRAGQTVRIPGSNADFAFQLQGPTGVETVKAFASLKDVPFLSPSMSRDIGPVRQATVPENQLASDIVTKLRNLPINYWAEDEYEIYVGY